MAKIFQFTPSQVDEISYDRVMTMIQLDGEWRKKEAEDTKGEMKHGRRI